jgi:GT2 family glycosyltransferase
LQNNSFELATNPPVLFSVIVPSFNRGQQLSVTIKKILACASCKFDLLINVDAGDLETPKMLEKRFSGKVHWICASTRSGPGGGRNVLIKMAQTPWLVSFDDDSWPESPDFFERLGKMIAVSPKAGALAFPINVRGQKPAHWQAEIRQASCFENCGCAIRREAFLQTDGFLPLRHAYGMEEADVALQLLDRGWEILNVPDLWVYHDTGMEHHASPPVNAAQISNTALLAFLRYPITLWPLGILQTINRVKYAISMRRFRGIAKGLWGIPFACWKYRAARKPVKAETIHLARKLRSVA